MPRFAAIAFILALLSGRPEATQAGSPTEDYLAARDRYIAIDTAQDKAINSQNMVLRRTKGYSASEQYYDAAERKLMPGENRHLADLQNRLRTLIGSLKLPGFPAQGESNVGTLSAEVVVGFGMLDGLSFTSRDGQTTIIVTTVSLFRNWLMPHPAWGRNQTRFPQDLGSALRSDYVSQEIFNDDMAVYSFGDLPVATAPQTTFVHATPILQSMDGLPEEPSAIEAAVIRGDKAYIARQTLLVTPKAFPVCDQIYARYEKWHDRVNAKLMADLDKLPTSPPTKIDPYPQPPMSEWSAEIRRLDHEEDAIENNGEAAYRRCFAAHMRRQSYYPAVVRQAKALVDKLATQ